MHQHGVPALVIFGGMGWISVPIDIGSVLTACVALGIAVNDTFAGSDFVPTSKFVVLMCALLLAALIGDLLFLPAMLAGPIGRYFVGHPNPMRSCRQESP